MPTSYKEHTLQVQVATFRLCVDSSDIQDKGFHMYRQMGLLQFKEPRTSVKSQLLTGLVQLKTP